MQDANRKSIIRGARVRYTSMIRHALERCRVSAIQCTSNHVHISFSRFSIFTSSNKREHFNSNKAFMGSGPSLLEATKAMRHLEVKLQEFQHPSETDCSSKKLCQLSFLFNYVSNKKSDGLLNYAVSVSHPVSLQYLINNKTYRI